MFFRLVSLLLTLAVAVLSAWSLVGSYKNKSYLTDNYLITVQLSNVNVSALISEANAKRDLPEDFDLSSRQIPKPDRSLPLDQRDLESVTAELGNLFGSATADVASLVAQATNSGSVPTNVASLVNQATKSGSISTGDILSQIQSIVSTASIPDSVATLAAGLAGADSISALVKNLNALDLGLADMYSIGYWGYCRGTIEGKNKFVGDLGKVGKPFSNKNVDYNYCSPPKAGYKFDPLGLLRREIVNHIKDEADGVLSALAPITDALSAQLLAIAGSITYEDLGFPGDLKKNLDLLHRVTVASFALILVGTILAVISFVFQLTGLCCSPKNMCLSVMNYAFMILMFIVVLVGSALSTGGYIYARKEVNDNIDQFGAKSFLSVQYYALLWSAVAAGLLLVIFMTLGYCCGCFHSSPRYNRVNPEPQMLYDHKPYGQ